MKDAETRWGQAVVEIIRRKREECEASVSDPAIVFANKKLCAIIDARFALKAPEATFGAFRPLLELVVPNGLLGRYEVTQKVSTFSCANSQNPTVSSTTAEMNLPPVAAKKVASTSANGVDEDSESQNLKTVNDSIDDLTKSVMGDDETQALLNSVSAKLESMMVSAGADLLPANTSSAMESNHLLRSATPTFAHSLASAFGRRTLISSSTHHLSNNSTTINPSGGRRRNTAIQSEQ